MRGNGVTPTEGDPHDRLTRLCAVMTDALDTDPERGDVKCVAFLNSDEEGKGGVQLHGWDYDSDALPAIFMHPRAIVRSQQGELLFAPLGDDG